MKSKTNTLFYIFITILLVSVLTSCNQNNKPPVNTQDDDTIAVGDPETNKEPSDTIDTDYSANLFDKSAAIAGQIFYHSSSGPSLIDNTDGFYSYVQLRGAGTYRLKVSVTHHGIDYALRIPILNSEKAFLSNVQATPIDETNRDAVLVEFVVTENIIENGAAYIAFDGDINYINHLMIVKDIDYPAEYVPYGIYDASNTLYGKSAIFIGDSICAGKTVGESLPEFGYGWAGLIGQANNMAWSNLARSGAVITPTVPEHHIIGDQVDSAVSQFPLTDYFIFEGGTNDADELKVNPANIGAVDPFNFTDFDTSTFSGAFESMILKIKSAYPNAKLGYIVPPKMGNPPYDSANSARRQYFDRAVEICNKWGIPYLDLWNSCEFDPSNITYYDPTLGPDANIDSGKYYTDGQHLTLIGYNAIVPMIEEFMRGL